jgi:hypothetical protein
MLPTYINQSNPLVRLIHQDLFYGSCDRADARINPDHTLREHYGLEQKDINALRLTCRSIARDLTPPNHVVERRLINTIAHIDGLQGPLPDGKWAQAEHALTQSFHLHGVDVYHHRRAISEMAQIDRWSFRPKAQRPHRNQALLFVFALHGPSRDEDHRHDGQLLVSAMRARPLADYVRPIQDAAQLFVRDLPYFGVAVGFTLAALFTMSTGVSLARRASDPALALAFWMVGAFGPLGILYKMAPPAVYLGVGLALSGRDVLVDTTHAALDPHFFKDAYVYHLMRRRLAEDADQWPIAAPLALLHRGQLQPPAERGQQWVDGVLTAWGAQAKRWTTTLLPNVCGLLPDPWSTAQPAPAEP